MTVYKNLFLTLISGISLASATAHSSALFIDKTLAISGAIGYTQFKNPANQNLIISNYVSDLLTNNTQHHKPTFTISAKQQINIYASMFTKIMLGPSLYFQQAHNSGDVWEMSSVEFYNYQYAMKSHNTNVLLESDVHFKPIARITPFLTAGIGFGVAHMTYNDYALPEIPVDSERHWSRSQTKAVYELGAGLRAPITSHWALDLRYAWFYRGKTSSTFTQYQAINMNVNNQTVLLGVHYFL